MKVSVVCPFYNESAIIEKAAQEMLQTLRRFGDEERMDWEFIGVNDGSRDNSLELIQTVLHTEPRARLISYEQNQGRGFALKTGIDAATGDIIVTTEMDLSWGADIVRDICKKFKTDSRIDVVIASPHLTGGGYRNVPRKRVVISQVGNMILRVFFTKKITMNTGMTRGYRREVIQPLRTEEKGKEFHLEVLLKLVNLGCYIVEIPATLEWKDHKLAQEGSQKRKSSSNITQLIFSHLNFAVFANPIRYFWAFSLACILAGGVALLWAFERLLTGQPSIYLALMSLLLGLFGLLFFGFGIVTAQNNRIMKELWRKSGPNP
jgi:glycosyltransferase involved in cell wall biosynthesis